MATLEIIPEYTGIYYGDTHYHGTFLPYNSSQSFNIVYRFKLTGPAVVTVKLIIKDKNGRVIKTLTSVEDWSHLQDETVYTYNYKQFGSYTLSSLGGDDLFLTWQFYLNGNLEYELPDLVHLINASKIVELGYLEIVDAGLLVKYKYKTTGEIYGWYTSEGQPIPACIKDPSTLYTSTIRAVVNFKLDDPGDRGYRIELKGGRPGFMDRLSKIKLSKGINVISGSDYISYLDGYYIEIYFYYNKTNDNSVLVHSYSWNNYVTTGCDSFPKSPPNYAPVFEVVDVTMPSTITVGQYFDLKVTLKNSGNVSGTTNLKIPIFAIDKEVELKAGETKTIDFGSNFAFTRSGTYSICATADSSEKCITVNVLPSEPDIQITDIFTNLDTVVEGETITLTVKLTNKGGARGTITLNISVNNSTFKTESITLDPLKSTIKTYNITAEQPGTMTICAEVV